MSASRRKATVEHQNAIGCGAPAADQVQRNKCRQYLSLNFSAE